MLISFRKQWKKATEAERIGLDILQAEKKAAFDKVSQSRTPQAITEKERTHKNLLLQQPVLGQLFLTERRVGASECQYMIYRRT